MRTTIKAGMIQTVEGREAFGVLTRKEAANALGVSESAIDLYARRGLLDRAYPLGGKRAKGVTLLSVQRYAQSSSGFCPPVFR